MSEDAYSQASDCENKSESPFKNPLKGLNSFINPSNKFEESPE